VLARATLPRARHVELHDCGHVPMSDDPELVASTIFTTTAAARPT
jgi:pimeloyl-ACP methyl ester carboxylesterase